MQNRPGPRMKERLSGVHRDSTWHGFFGLWQVQAKDAVLELGVDLVLIDDFGKVKLTENLSFFLQSWFTPPFHYDVLVRVGYSGWLRPICSVDVDDQALLTSICFTSAFGSAFLGIVTVNTPFLKVAVTSFWSASSGSDSIR